MLGDFKSSQAALALGAMVLLFILGALASIAHAGARTQAHDQDVSIATSLVLQNRDDKKSSQSLFVPATDLNGASNADGHAWDFYRQDIHWVGHFYEYCYRAAATDCNGTDQAMNTVAEYAYTWAQRTAGTGYTLQRSAISGPTAMSMTEVDGSAAIAALSEMKNVPGGITCTQKVYHWAYPGVTSANCRLYRLVITMGTFTQAYDMGDTLIPFANTVITADATPTPNAETATSALSFRAPVAAAQSASVAESNYGNHVTTPPQVYTLGTACNSLTSISPSSPVTPSNNGNGATTLTVTPTLLTEPTGADCTITVTDNTPQTEYIAVTIGDSYTPGATGIDVSYSPGVSSAVTVTEQNYDVPTGRGGMTLIGYLSNGSQPLSSADTSGDPNGVCSTPPGTSGRTGYSLGAAPGYVETESWSIAFDRAGVCYPVFQDVYGQRASVNGSNGIDATAAIKSWPQQLVLGVGGGPVGTTSGSSPIAFTQDLFTRAFGPILNQLLLGGVAEAAAPAQPCYALGETNGFTSGANPASYVDTSLPASVSAALGIYVDSNGCEVDDNDDPIAASQAGTVVYNAASTTSTYSELGSTCGGLAYPTWLDSTSAVQSLLGVEGEANGTCSITFSGTGLSAATGFDSGVVAVTVQTLTVLVYTDYMTDGVGYGFDSFWANTEGAGVSKVIAFTSSDGGTTWTFAYYATCSNPIGTPADLSGCTNAEGTAPTTIDAEVAVGGNYPPVVYCEAGDQTGCNVVYFTNNGTGTIENYVGPPIAGNAAPWATGSNVNMPSWLPPLICYGNGNTPSYSGSGPACSVAGGPLVPYIFYAYGYSGTGVSLGQTVTEP